MDEWLEEIGLGGRVAAFRAQGIAREHAPLLTDEDLRELGLTIGERKRFLSALMRAVDTGSARERAAEERGAERRPLTMMFVDLVGSSRLSEELEPEDMMEVIRRYRDFAAGPIVRYGGRIARMVGDGILAYFCYPVANENDPERSVRAALDLVSGIGRVVGPGGEGLAVRIGIATGSVIVGDLLAADVRERHAIIGAPPNVAARMQGLAPPNGIVIAEATFQRVKDRFILEELGTHELRGMSRPHPAWLALGIASASDHRARHQPLRAERLCGRTAELAALRAGWAAARRGHGSTVLLQGEAGIGKSRLIEALLDDSAGAAVITLAGSPFETDSPLRPVTAWLHAVAGPEDAGDTARAQRLHETLPGWSHGQAVIAPLLGLAPRTGGPEAGQIAALRPDQLREITLQALADLLTTQSESQPLCLVLEDLHWFDPTSLELVGRLAAAAAGRPLFVLATAREEFAAAETLGQAMEAGTLSVMRLDRLDAKASADLAASMLAGQAVSASLIALVNRKAAGVPLFVEEVVRLLHERGDLARHRDDASEALIPASLHEALAGRLDRTGEAKEVAQAAAVIGRAIRRDVLARVCAARGLDAPALDRLIGGLLRGGVLQPDETSPHAREQYVFSHALLADAAYSSLLRDERRALHLCAASALAACDPESLQTQPEVHAAHMTEGGDALAAAPYWHAAAERSLARSALTEASRLLRRGLAGLDTLARSAAVDTWRVKLTGLLGPVLMSLRGPGAPETQTLYNQGADFCRQLPEHPSHFPIYWGWWRVSPDFHTMTRRSAALLSYAQERRNPDFLLQAHHCSWASCYHLGQFGRSLEHIEAGLAIHGGGNFRHHAALFGNHDPLACAWIERMLIRWMQGRSTSALEDERAASQWAETLDHLGTHIHVLDGRVLHGMKRRDHKHVVESTDRMTAFAAEHGLDDHLAKAKIFRGWAIGTTVPLTGLAMIREGFSMQQDIGTSEDFTIYVCLLAETLVAAGRPDEAAEELAKARASFDQQGLRMWMPEVIRNTADAILAGGSAPRATALDLLAQAEAIAVEQDVPMLALRAATTRARWARGRDEARDAAAALRASIDAIPEPEGALDVRLATEQLASLSEALPRAVSVP